MNLTLSLTHACNLDCTYCYAGAHGPRAMTWEVAKRAIDGVFAAAAIGDTGDGEPGEPGVFGRAGEGVGPFTELTLAFFGGEPLLAWPLLQRACEYAQNQADQRGVAMAYAVTTNGLLLTEERLAWLAEWRFYVAISMDGNRAMHEATRPTATGRSSFEATAAAVRRALPWLPDLEVITVVDPANVMHLADGVRYLANELRVPDISLNPNFSADWQAASFAQWRAGFEAVGDLYVERFTAGDPLQINFIDSKVITHLKGGYSCADRCSFGEQELAVAPSGRLYPCERLIGEDTPALAAAISIGDVTGGLHAQKHYGFLAQRGNIDTPCTTCAIRTRCMNWCGCVNYATTGAIDRTHGVLCFHEKLAVEVADGVAARLFQAGTPGFLARFYGADTPAAPHG